MRRSKREPMDHEAALGAVRAVYEALEERPVERQCVSRSECCRFRLTGKTPYLTAGEALVLADFLRRTGRARLESKRDGSCPLLNEVTGRCEAYSARPFGCRTHFCEAAGGPYSRKEVVDLIRRLEAVDEALFGEGARALEIALREALQRPPVRGRPR